MAHKIDMSNGRANFAYSTDDDAAEGRPWHGLGVGVRGLMKAEECIKLAGLDFDVFKVPLVTSLGFTGEADGGPVDVGGLHVPGRFAVVRSDTRAIIGTVGSTYTHMQNRRAFDVFDMLAASGQAEYHTAGSLKGGALVWMLASLKSFAWIKGTEDRVGKHLLYANGHDGRTILQMLMTPIRVVCWNTLTASLAMGNCVKIRHTPGMEGRMADAADGFGVALRYYDDFQARIQGMADRKLTKAQRAAYFEACYPDGGEGTGLKAKGIRSKMAELLETGRGTAEFPQHKGNAWGAYNAVTEWVDHHRKSRAGDGSTAAENKLESIWLGTGAALKSRAFDEAVALCN